MDDFQDAARRHLQDGSILLSQAPARLANASQLYGLSTECALKAIARQHDPLIKFTGQKGHIPLLFNEIANITTVCSNSILSSGISTVKTLFVNWSISQRYENESTFTSAVLISQENGAKQAKLLMDNVLKGLI